MFESGDDSIYARGHCICVLRNNAEIYGVEDNYDDRWQVGRTRECRTVLRDVVGPHVI